MGPSSGPLHEYCSWIGFTIENGVAQLVSNSYTERQVLGLTLSKDGFSGKPHPFYFCSKSASFPLIKIALKVINIYYYYMLGWSG